MSVEESKNKWREQALGGRFFGEPVANLDREDLLAVIGCLLASAEVDRKQRISERETWATISRA